VFQHILVPTDLTDRTRRSLETALGMAKPFDARVTLLHVIETIPGTTFEELAEFYGKLEDKARGAMAEQVRRAGTGRTQVAQRVVYGRRAQEIVRFAADEQVDLIVLASHRLDPAQGQAGLGAISYRVGILSTCHVLLVK